MKLNTAAGMLWRLMAFWLVVPLFQSVVGQDAERIVDQDESSAPPTAKLRPGFRMLAKVPDLQYQVQGVDAYTPHGYRPIHVRVANDGDQKYRVRLVGKFNSDGDYYLTYCESSSSEQAELEAGSIAKLTIYVPNLAAELSQLYLEVNGALRPIRHVGELRHANGPPNGMKTSTSFLLSPDLDAPAWIDAIDATYSVETVNNYRYEPDHGYYMSGPSGPGAEVIKGPLISQWTDQWIAYSAFSHVIVSNQFFDTLGPGVKNALREYVSVGGNLTILDRSESPESFEDVHLKIFTKVEILNELGFDDAPIHAQYGLGSLNLMEFTFIKGSLNYETELGDLVEFLLANNSQSEFYAAHNGTHPQFSLPMFEKKEVNKGLIFWGVFLFIGIVGPVNYLVCRLILSNMMMLLVTTPAFSILVSIIFVIGDYAAHGTKPTTIMETCTILDQREKHAVTIGTTGYYTPVRPRPIQFDMDTEVLPYFENFHEERWDREERTPASIRFEDDKQVLVSGWLEARKQTYFHLRKSQRSELRVTFQRNDNGDIEIINGLGVNVVSIKYRDKNGTCYSASNVGAGETAVLEQQSIEPAFSEERVPDSLSALRPLQSHVVFEKLIKSYEIGLGHYVAETEKSAFVDPVQENAIEKPASCYVYGIPEEVELP